MAYIINKTDGTQLVNVADGTIDNQSSSITLVGKNYAGYGEFLNENFIKLLENTASGAAPSSPLEGQLWYDKNTKVLNVYNGNAWRSVSTTTASSSAPTAPAIGEAWFDSTTGQFKIWDGTQFLIVGPAVPSELGDTGAVASGTLDNVGGEHIIVELSTDGQTVAVISAEAFTPAPGTLPGFSSILPGLNLASGSYINGASFSSINCDTLTADVSVGTNSIENTGAAGTGDIGSALVPFDTIYAQATSAQYADLAERYAADAAYEAGTVVEIGGEAEVTSVKEELSEAVFGVVSAHPAYLMNATAGDNDSHPAIAVAGRVPVKVVGPVNKGDRLVSAGNGLARAGTRDEITPFNVIGRALTTKTTIDEGTVEAVVKIN